MQPNTAPDSRRTTGPLVGRRQVVQTAAWAAPVISMAAASPAFAASGPLATLLIAPAVTDTTLCTDVSSLAFTLTATRDGKSADIPSGTLVRITLPAGVAVASSTGATATVVDYSVPSAAISASIPVPAFSVVGAAGTYTIRAEVVGATPAVTAFAIVTAAVTGGAVHQIRRESSSNLASATYDSISLGMTAVLGATSGTRGSTDGTPKFSTGANSAIITGSTLPGSGVTTSPGQLWLWGTNLGSTTPFRFQPTATPEQKFSHASTWTSANTATDSGASFANRTGGVASGEKTDSVYQWLRQGDVGVSPSVSQGKVSFPGAQGETILDLVAGDVYSYALTASGVHYWRSDTVASLTAALVADTAGATQLSVWSHADPTSPADRITHGGAALIGSGATATLRVWQGRQLLSTPPAEPTEPAAPEPVSITPPSGTSPIKMIASDSAVYVLTASGALIATGPTWKTGTDFTEPLASNAWNTVAASGVADFAHWGYFHNQYWSGGAYIDTLGQVTGFTHSRWTTSALASEYFAAIRVTSATGPRLNKVVQVFASDGNHMALTSEGKVYSWGGNADNAAGTPRSQVATQINLPGTDAVDDLNIWGHRLQGTYVGGGYVVASSAC